MATFVEGEFPRTISFKAMGGPGFNTTVNQGKSGYEQRNQNWLTSRGKWTVSLDTPGPSSNVNQQTFIDDLNAFFLVIGGRENGFRLKDHKEFTNGSIAQEFAVSDGVTTNWQLIKTYTSCGLSYVRAIVKPVTSKVVNYLNQSLTDTVTVYANGAALPANPGYVAGGSAKYALDETTGSVNFGSGTTVLTITSLQSINGYIAYYYTVAGPAPVKNQQVFFTGLSTSGANGTFLITALGTGYILTNNPSSIGQTTDSGSGYTGWGLLGISGVTASAGTSVYAYTQTLGGAPVQGQRVTITGFGNAANNGTFYITAIGAGTFSVANTSGVTQSATAIGVTDWVPAVGIALTAAYQFDFAVRFDTDDLQIQLEESNVEGGAPIISWNSIGMMELRIAPGASTG